MYYLVHGIFYLLSLLPLKLLYLVSDFIYLLLYYVAGYRKKVVMRNISIVFPEKSPEEKTRIAKTFYRNLTDTIAEIIKLFSAGPRFINKHVTGDYHVVNALYDEGRKCQIHLGHNFNWEMANLAAALNLKHKFLGVYMPLENKAFDRLLRKLRSKFGTVLISAKNIRNEIVPYRNDRYLLGLVADQTPSWSGNSYWVQFFNIPTAFVRGPEKGAVAGNIPVVFVHITKKKRGYYHIHFELAEKEPASLPHGELTKRYARFLEQVITTHPEMWLWSHRRWKLQWKEEYGPVL